jgi:hypothetical protein
MREVGNKMQVILSGQEYEDLINNRNMFKSELKCLKKNLEAVIKIKEDKDDIFYGKIPTIVEAVLDGDYLLDLIYPSDFDKEYKKFIKDKLTISFKHDLLQE